MSTSDTKHQPKRVLNSGFTLAVTIGGISYFPEDPFGLDDLAKAKGVTKERTFRVQVAISRPRGFRGICRIQYH